ncbi:MAG: glycoside hydrolase family 65 protein [Clostridia bacterium]|nr:glycoside hydrolase family 65 protein [Clostridia bacterium]
MWKLTKNEYDPSRQLVEESLFMVGNGYIGVRGCFEEEYPKGLSVRGTYINGLFDHVPMIHAEMAYGFPTVQDKQPRISDTQTCLIWLDGERAALYEGRYETYYRHVDYQRGETERSYIYITQSGKKAHLKFNRLASMVNPHVLAYKIEVIYDGQIEFISVLDGDIENYSNPEDPRTGQGHTKLMEVLEMDFNDLESSLLLETKTTKIKQATMVRHNVSSPVEYELWHVLNDQKIETRISGKNHLTLEKICVMTDSIRMQDALGGAISIQSAFEGHSYDGLRESQTLYLDRFWKHSDIEIIGNPSDQRAIRFMQYQLLQSVGIDAYSNVSAKGLSGEGYEGHYFWDTEIYVLPVLMINQPERAKHLLEYRYHILENAKKRAKELGQSKGAAYAWRTISGIECSGYFPAGTAQYHINSDIAHAFIQYQLFTDDWNFLVDKGAEVIFETARTWLEIGHLHNGAFHLHGVTGPDEYTAIVSDNYYTNAMAKHHMHWAYKIYEQLRDHEDPLIRSKFSKLMERINLTAAELNQMMDASERMVMPYDEKLGIFAQDATFLSKPVWPFDRLDPNKKPLLLHYHPLTIYRHQVLKQADTILAHFLLEDYADEQSICRGFDYYEKITTHDSSLSSCIYGIMASRCGYRKKAYDYFSDAVFLDLKDTHGNTKDGLHIANISGTILSVIAGFAGFRNTDSGLRFRPYVPSEWEGYSFRMIYKGRDIKVSVNENFEVVLLKGDAVVITVFDEQYELTATQPVIKPLEKKEVSS